MLLAVDICIMKPRSTFGLIEVICCLFILLWIYAAANKLLDVQTFHVKLGQSPLLTPIAGWVAWFIPLLEIAVAFCLAFPALRRVGLFASYGLMVMFTAYIIAVTHFSDYIPCSCGGILENMSWNQHLIFNAGFLMLALTGIILHHKNFVAISRGSRKPV